MKILMRLGKIPTTVSTIEEVCENNNIGNNSGNLLFQYSAYKCFSHADNVVESYGYRADPNDADRINNEYDVFVLPLANAFRQSYIPTLNRYTALIQKLKIPVVVMGVGAQASKASLEDMPQVNEEVKNFCRAVLDRSSAIGVRGEFTYEYLKSLGFNANEIEIIGCPSMFTFGKDLPTINTRHLGAYSRISINSTEGKKDFRPIFVNNIRRYKNLCFIPQTIETLKSLSNAGPDLLLKESLAIPMKKINETKLFVDINPWINFLRGFDFSFGTRIHGNVISLLAGVPAHVVAHDSRTLELAKYFEIPYSLLQDLDKSTLAEDLYAKSSYKNFNANHGTRFDRFSSFLKKNGLNPKFGIEHNRQFEMGQANIKFSDPATYTSTKEVTV
jgi:hypothetical protein